jgi:hypothetical protein
LDSLNLSQSDSFLINEAMSTAINRRDTTVGTSISSKPMITSKSAKHTGNSYSSDNDDNVSGKFL